jgi:hypothetical protein
MSFWATLKKTEQRWSGPRPTEVDRAQGGGLATHTGRRREKHALRRKQVWSGTEHELRPPERHRDKISSGPEATDIYGEDSAGQKMKRVCRKSEHRLQTTETLLARIEEQARTGQVRTKEREASDPTQTELKKRGTTYMSNKKSVFSLRNNKSTTDSRRSSLSLPHLIHRLKIVHDSLLL